MNMQDSVKTSDSPPDAQSTSSEPHYPSSAASSAFSLSFNLPDTRPPSPTFSESSNASTHTMASSTTPLSLRPRRELLRSNTAERAERDYFSTNPPPKTLELHSQLAKDFIEYHSPRGHRVVLITSGGTTVPLERQTVRFIDNFSAGTRGATSAEYFLQAGYAVIFLHRQFSLQPYSRHYSHDTESFLDFLSESPDGRVVAKPEHQEEMMSVLRKYNAAKSKNLLLSLPFTTITDYLFVLRSISQLMRPLGPRGLLYLAAAVSDFFVPPDRMVEHKIQSTDAVSAAKSQQSRLGIVDKLVSDTDSALDATTDSPQLSEGEEEEVFDNFDSSPRVPRSKRLIVDLDPVPKFLKNLVDGWAPEGMIVSFKLETDPTILVHKAEYSLERYQHHLVIGNLLSTRKWEVVFVSKEDKELENSRIREQWIRVAPHGRTKSVVGAADGLKAVARKDDEGHDMPSDPAEFTGEPDVEIESLIIPAVEKMHTRHIERHAKKALA